MTKKYKLVGTNHNGYIGAIWFEHSVCTIDFDDFVQARAWETMLKMGDFKFEEIKEEPQPEKTTVDFIKSDVEERSENIGKDIKIDIPVKKAGRPAGSNRSGSKKSRRNTRNSKKKR